MQRPKLGITDPQSAFAQEAQSSLMTLIQEVESNIPPFTKPMSQII
ncbi:MAG: hypothetical protein ACH346_00175 [Chthoniobacterales bacterium]